MALQLVEMDWFVVMCQLNRTKSWEEDTVERTHTTWHDRRVYIQSVKQHDIHRSPASCTVQWVCRDLANGSRLIKPDIANTTPTHLESS